MVDPERISFRQTFGELGTQDRPRSSVFPAPPREDHQEYVSHDDIQAAQLLWRGEFDDMPAVGEQRESIAVESGVALDPRLVNKLVEHAVRGYMDGTSDRSTNKSSQYDAARLLGQYDAPHLIRPGSGAVYIGPAQALEPEVVLDEGYEPEDGAYLHRKRLRIPTPVKWIAIIGLTASGILPHTATAVRDTMHKAGQSNSAPSFSEFIKVYAGHNK